MGYKVEGRLLEACSCDAPCPCWIGDDPDKGTCDALVAYHYDKGHINGLDVSGLTLALVTHIPGNVLKGNWQVAVHVDSKATTDAQGRPTKLVDTVFSTIPGSPAYVGKATSFTVNQPEHDMVWSFNGRNAVLGDFLFEG